MQFDPMKSAAEMTAAELMAAHVAMSMPDASDTTIVVKTKGIYAELNRQMGKDEEETSSPQ